MNDITVSHFSEKIIELKELPRSTEYEQEDVKDDKGEEQRT